MQGKIVAAPTKVLSSYKSKCQQQPAVKQVPTIKIKANMKVFDQLSDFPNTVGLQKNATI